MGHSGPCCGHVSEMAEAIKELERRFRIIDNAVRGTMRFLERKQHVGRSVNRQLPPLIHEEVHG